MNPPPPPPNYRFFAATLMECPLELNIASNLAGPWLIESLFTDYLQNI